jgi:pimeloyl-ACP methyl ester carboxylesterase
MNKRWIVAGGGTLAAVGGARAVRSYRGQMHEIKRRLDAGSTVADTAYGPIEYATVGDGPAVLVAHGIGGGYDQGMLATRLTKEVPFKTIAISRFGYLRTPLARYKTPEEQADAYAALLDKLGIDKVAMVGISAGGTSAVHFALRHPDRCWALVSIAGVTRPFDPKLSHSDKAFVALVNRDLGLWLLTRLAEGRLYSIYNITPSLRDSMADQPEKLKVIRSILFSFPMNHRRLGFENDLANFPRIPTLPVERIAVPTLAVHGTADTVVPLEHSRFLADNVPSARLLSVEGGGHLSIVTHTEQALTGAMEFLKKISLTDTVA